MQYSKLDEADDKHAELEVFVDHQKTVLENVVEAKEQKQSGELALECGTRDEKIAKIEAFEKVCSENLAKESQTVKAHWVHFFQMFEEPRYPNEAKHKLIEEIGKLHHDKQKELRWQLAELKDPTNLNRLLQQYKYIEIYHRELSALECKLKIWKKSDDYLQMLVKEVHEAEERQRSSYRCHSRILAGLCVGVMIGLFKVYARALYEYHS